MRKGLGFHNRHSPGGAPPLPATNPDFKNVVLLLPGSGTNGAQNNTFLDSSTNAFSITRNGNTTQGTFSPYGDNWSSEFSPTANYLQVASNAAFNFGTGDFTVEAWFFVLTGVGAIACAAAGTKNGWSFELGTQPRITIGNGTTITTLGAGLSISLNVWNHVALVRNGTTFSIYLNGVNITSNNTITLANATTSPVWIGRGFGVSGGSFSASNSSTAFISNVRIVKGTAVYTSNFVPSTTPLTAITGTSLLTCQNNRFIDNSTNAFPITVFGTPSARKFSPFAPAAAYDPATIGGSGYFDGTGDYLSIADDTAIRFGTGNFTIQAWVYRNSAGATHTIAAKGGTSTGWVFQITSGNVLRFTDTTTNIDTTTTIASGVWTHVAVVRSGTGANQLKLYINGVDSATGTSSTDFNQTEQLNIGADRDNTNTMNGLISNLKYTVGTAETITVPTSPITGGAVLLNFTNAGIIDNAMMNDMETLGNAQISNAQAKWGSTSISFDGTGDWLVMPDAPPQRFGTGNFTIEGWLYLNATGVAYGVISKGTATTGWSVNVTSGDKLQFSHTATQLTGATSLVSGQWYHFAVVRNGTGIGNLRIYLNGSVDAISATAITTDFNQTNVQYVGADRVGGSSLNGYVQDARITRTAVYTANFTPPTAAFPLF